MLMEYHRFDTQNSSTYDKSRHTHVRLDQEKSEEVARMSGVYHRNAFEMEDIVESRAIECQKDAALEHHLWTDQYNVPKYKTFCPTVPAPTKQTWSDCLGYRCNRTHPHEFMYTLDEFNTYHNYLVCDAGRMTCCPKNTQIFNNWTRRHHSTMQGVKPPTTLILEENPIPGLTMRECSINRTTTF